MDSSLRRRSAQPGAPAPGERRRGAGGRGSLGVAQLSLALWNAAQDFARFVDSGANRAALSRLERVVRSGGVCYLHGAPGSGRSHLLNACCTAADGAAAFLAPDELAGVPPAGMLEALERCRLVCIDDLERLAGREAWEAELFHLLNRSQAALAGIVVAAAAPPSAVGLALPDLASRLAAGGVYRLAPLDESGMREALRREAARRGLSLDDKVARYMVAHAERDMRSLLALLDALDAAVTGSGRALSVPLVRRAIHGR